MPPLDLGNFNTPASMARDGLYGSPIPATSAGSGMSQAYTAAAARQAQQTPPPAPVKPANPIAPMTWDDVLAHPDMTNLSGEQLEAARRQYFADVVAPKVPTDRVQQAWDSFDEATNPAIVSRIKRATSALVDVATGSASGTNGTRRSASGRITYSQSTPGATMQPNQASTTDMPIQQPAAAAAAASTNAQAPAPQAPSLTWSQRRLVGDLADIEGKVSAISKDATLSSQERTVGIQQLAAEYRAKRGELTTDLYESHARAAGMSSKELQLRNEIGDIRKSLRQAGSDPNLTDAERRAAIDAHAARFQEKAGELSDSIRSRLNDVAPSPQSLARPADSSDTADTPEQFLF